MSTRRRKQAPPAFVRWLQLLFATVLAKHAPLRAKLARRLGRVPGRPQSAPRRRGPVNDFAPTQVMKRTDDVVDERSLYSGAGVDVSEEDLETLPAELREAFLGDHRRPHGRGETAAAA